MAKIIPFDKITSSTAPLHRANKTIVFATGVFDLLHPAHIVFLKKARAEGDILIVGVESDEKARAAKGPGRPIHNQQERMALVAALSSVDYVTPLPYIRNNNHYLDVCRRVHAKKLAITAGDLYMEKKKEIMEAIGGHVVIVTKRLHPHSTTKLVEKIQAQAVV